VLFNEPKVIQRQTLNIQSGNGRLDSLLKDFFMKIDCVDAFKGEISKAVEQKIQVELRK
jgi:hypothetical protein